jgi:hypothetical protein
LVLIITDSYGCCGRRTEYYHRSIDPSLKSRVPGFVDQCVGSQFVVIDGRVLRDERQDFLRYCGCYRTVE